MNRDFSVRLYRSADQNRCAGLFEQVMRETFPEDDPPEDDPEAHSAATFADDTAGETIWVAESGKDIVGLVSFWPTEPYIHFLLILPRWRRRGVGTALMRVATQSVEGPVDLKCRLDNDIAQRFFEALGWREVDRDVGDPAPYIRYRR